MKHCSKCLQEKPLDQFNRRGQSHSTYCKGCNSAYLKEHYKSNKERYLLRNEERRKKLHEFVQSFKDVPCCDCNQKFPSVCMDFDHLSDKTFNVSEMAHRLLSKEIILKEIKKCQIVCANCHRIRMAERLAARLGFEPR